MTDEEWMRMTTAKAAMHPDRLASLQGRASAIQRADGSDVGMAGDQLNY